MTALSEGVEGRRSDDADLGARDAVSAFARAWNDHDLDRITASHTRDAVFEVVGLLRVEGHAAIREAAAGLFVLWPDMVFEQRDLSVHGGLVVHEFDLVSRLGIELTIGKLTASPTEEPIRFRGVDVIVLDEHRLVARKTTYLDYLTAQRELGLA